MKLFNKLTIAGFALAIASASFAGGDKGGSMEVIRAKGVEGTSTSKRGADANRNGSNGMSSATAKGDDRGNGGSGNKNAQGN